MGAVASRSQVGEHLARLEEAYGPFPVDQTTVSVTTSVYERACERADEGVLDAIVRVWNDDGEVLHRDDAEGWDFPRHRSESVESFPAALESAFDDELGLSVAVDGVHRVTIAGVRDRSDPDAETVYLLFVVVDASHLGGTPETGEWRPLDADAEDPRLKLPQ